MIGFEEAQLGSRVYLWTRGVVWTRPDLFRDFCREEKPPFQWVCSSLKHDLIPNSAQAFDRNFDNVSIPEIFWFLHRHRNTCRRACRNDVAFLHRHYGAQASNYFLYRDYHIYTRGFLPQLSVHLGNDL